MCVLVVYPTKLEIGVQMKNNNILNFIKSLIVFGAFGFVAFNLSCEYVKADNENLEEKLFKRIEASAGLNQLDKVKDDIKRVLKLNPKHAGATFYAGKYCLQRGDFENAEKFLKRVTYDPTYGQKANKLLADIKIKKYNSRFITNLKVYLNGESFDQALKLCEDALEDMPDNHELLFSAAYASCMLGKKEKAETYTELYALQVGNTPQYAELKTLVDAWFTDSFENDVAIEKFLSLKSKNILTSPVKKRIKQILIANKAIDKYEDFIKKEISQPGSDKDAVERELITFLLEQNQFNKALELLNNRPVDSLEDNLLYCWALCQTNEEIKALNAAKHLMTAAPRDLRVYKAWIEAWLSYTEKNKNTPDGRDSDGTPYQNTVERILRLLRPDKLVDKDPVLLIDLLRMASFSGKDEEAQKIHNEVAKIAFNDDLEPHLLKTCDELVEFEKSKMAINILESAVNQLPNNYNLSLKLAQIYMASNPSAAVRICEEVMEQQPDLIRAVIMWSDAMNLAGRGGEAISELIKRVSDGTLNDIAKRQLHVKIEQLRIQGAEDTPYTKTPKRGEGKKYGDDPGDSEEEEEDDSPDTGSFRSNPDSDSNSEPVSDSDSVSDSEFDSNSDSESESELDSDSESNSNSDINTYSPPESEELDEESFDE